MRAPGAVLLMSIVASGCGGPGTGASPARGPGSSVVETSTGATVRLESDRATSQTTVAADAERVWAVLPSVYEEMGIPAGVLDADRRTFGTERFTRTRIAGRRTEEYARCASSASGPSSVTAYRIRLWIATEVEAVTPGASLLRTRVTGSATPMEGTSTSASRCVSTGELEHEIATRVAAALSG